MKPALTAIMLLSCVITGCDAETPLPRIMNEDRFFMGCMQDKIDCIEVNFTAEDKKHYSVAYRYFSGRSSGIGKLMGINDEIVTNRYLCESKESRYIKAAKDDSGWIDLPISVQKGRDGKICVERYDLGNVGKGGILESGYRYTETRMGGYIYYFYPPANTRINVRVSGEFMDKVYMQSAMLSSGFVAGEAESFDFTYTSGNYPPDSFFAFTTYASTKEFTDEYNRKSIKFLDLSSKSEVAIHTGRLSNLDNLLLTYNALKLEFRANARNSGVLPQRGISEIIASGFAHCMDAAQVGRYLAARYKLSAVPVLTGTISPAPDVTMTADTQWLNHVILYFDELGTFVDLTAKPGDQVIDGDSFVYKHMGIRVDTGEYIVIK